MTCERCGTENRAGRRFCRACGAPLSASCPNCGTPAEPGDLTLEEAERRHISRTLRLTGGRIRGTGGAAERLGVHEATLRSRMKTLGIVRRAG